MTASVLRVIADWRGFSLSPGPAAVGVRLAFPHPSRAVQGVGVASSGARVSVVSAVTAPFSLIVLCISVLSFFLVNLAKDLSVFACLFLKKRSPLSFIDFFPAV